MTPTRRTIALAPALLLLGLGGMAGSACAAHIGPVDVIQGNGSARTESRDVGGFDQVALNGTGTLVVTQGDSEGLTVRADDNILSHLRSQVSGGRLELGPPSGTVVSSRTPIRYELTARALRSIQLAGSGAVQAARLVADQLDLGIAGSGRMDVGQLSATALTVRVDGSGTVTVAGSAARQTLDVAGSGTYRAADLASQRATIRIAGAGSAAVRVSDSLDVSVDGTGTVTYAGSPTVTQHVNGTGSVTRTG
jgi:hypothetical protein